MFSRAVNILLCLMVWVLAGNSYASASPVVETTLNEDSTFEDYIKSIGVRTFLSPEDVRTYSSDLTQIVGNYFYVEDDGMATFLGRPDAISKATTVQLKDKIQYQATTDNGGSLSATLPWLSFLFKDDTKTSILIQDIASVIGTSDPKVIKANSPTDAAPAGKQVWYVSGATVTLVSATLYSNRSFRGSAVIQVGGNTVYTRNTLQNAQVISLNKVRTSISPVAPAPASATHSMMGTINKEIDLGNAGNRLDSALDGKILKIKEMRKNK